MNENPDWTGKRSPLSIYTLSHTQAGTPKSQAALVLNQEMRLQLAACVTTEDSLCDQHEL